MYGQQISRRAFLNMCGATTAAALFGQSCSSEKKRIGLALGAGGARGLAHVRIHATPHRKTVPG